MSHCPNRPLLQALMDRELDAANTIAIEQHLNGCRDCAKALEDLQLVRDALAKSGVPYVATDAFKRRLTASLQLEAASTPVASPRRKIPPTPWWAPLSLASLAASLLVFVSVAQSLLANELVAGHVRSLQAEHLVDVKASNRHVVKPWFDGKVSFAPTVDDFAEQGFPLTGGRLDYVHDRPVAALVYKRGLHVINVFVWPSDTLTDRFGMRRQVDGYAIEHWQSKGLSYWAVSDLDRGDLGRFKSLYVAALR